MVAPLAKTTPGTNRRNLCKPSTFMSVLILILLVSSVLFHESRLAPITWPVGEMMTTMTTTTSPDSSAPSNGWHPIHVFFGNEEALLDGAAVPSNTTWFSQVGQDKVVVGLLGDGKDHYFIDLAANDAWELSNTLALEKRGWNGLCIEPNPVYWYGLSHRKCTVLGALVGGSGVNRVNVSFRGAYGGIVGFMNNQLAQKRSAPQAVTEKRYTAPLAQVFQRFQVPHVVDYMSLDVEGAEYLIMKDFPLDTYLIRLMTVERPSKELEKLLARHGYVYLTALGDWGETLWAHNSTGFTPHHPKVVSVLNQTTVL